MVADRTGRPYRTRSATGQSQFGLSGRDIVLLVAGDALHLSAEKGRGPVTIPIEEIKALRIGADFSFSPLVANDPQTVGRESVARRHVMSIRAYGRWTPLRVTTYAHDRAYRDFASALADTALAKGVRLERGVGYFVPLFFAGIAVFAVGRGAMETVSVDGRTVVIGAAIGVFAVAAALAVWTATIWWPRRVGSVSALARLFDY